MRLTSVFLAGWDTQNHGWIGWAVAMSGPYSERVDAWQSRDYIEWYWTANVAPNLCEGVSHA